VDCEDKKWRGQPVQRPAKAPDPLTPAPAIASGLSSSVTTVVPSISAAPADSLSPTGETDGESPSSDSSTQGVSHEQTPRLFLSAGMESPSWWAANKYVLAAVSIVGLVMAVMVWMR